jgi:hypothetical protein
VVWRCEQGGTAEETRAEESCGPTSWALGAEIIATRAMRTEDVRLGATPEMGCDGFWKPGQIKGGPAWYGQCTVAAKAERLRRRDRVWARLMGGRGWAWMVRARARIGNDGTARAIGQGDEERRRTSSLASRLGSIRGRGHGSRRNQQLWVFVAINWVH